MAAIPSPVWGTQIANVFFINNINHLHIMIALAIVIRKTIL